MRRFKVNKQQSNLRCIYNIAQRQKHAITVIGRKSDRFAVDHLHQTNASPLVGNGRLAQGIHRREEEEVPALNKGPVSLIEFLAHYRTLNGIR